MSSPPLADPTDLPSTSPKQTLQAVVETPRGSRNKYAYDHDLHTLVLKKVLPPGLFFPFDFGFFPSTLAPDGDPIDYRSSPRTACATSSRPIPPCSRKRPTTSSASPAPKPRSVCSNRRNNGFMENALSLSWPIAPKQTSRRYKYQGIFTTTIRGFPRKSSNSFNSCTLCPCSKFSYQ